METWTSSRETTEVINAFKKQEIPILVATDVAGNKQSIVLIISLS